ncbi:MAG TPA: hypothetical protein VJR89_33855 [Polyangiales bacterium]|nr:hypothetical protein [Polyangiales bacterium]
MLGRDLGLIALAAVTAGGFACGDQADDGARSAAGDSGSIGELEVGEACEPSSVPAAGFDPQEAYVEAHHAACGAGVCLAYRVAGDPRAACRSQLGACSASDPACSGPARCTDPAEVQKHVTCSCRCAGPNPQAAYCACPDGFVCAPVLDQGDASLVGSYCARP